MDLTILTLNLQGLGAGWFERRRGDLLPQLRALAPDVIALQEVAIRREPFYHQAQDLAEQVAMATVAYAPYGNPDEVDSPEQGGVALIARWPLRLVESLRLPPGRRHPDNRVALMASLQAGSEALHVAVTHLSWPSEERPERGRQLGALLARARGYGWHNERFVLAGDLNAPPDDPAIAALAGTFQDAWASAHPNELGHTWSHVNPLTGSYPMPSRRLDYLFVDERARVQEATLCFDDPARGYVSDHFGLLASFRWNDRLNPEEAGEQYR